MKLTKKEFKKARGFTLVEVLIYGLAIVFVMSVLVFLTLQLINVVENTRRSRESLDTARRVLDFIAQEIRHAEGVYTPTSVFGSDTGQLSLETKRDLPTDETSTYVDFYLDDSGVFVKREGQSEALISSQKVSVTKLNFTNLNGYSGNPVVRIQITTEYRSPISGPKSAVSLETTAALRSY